MYNGVVSRVSSNVWQGKTLHSFQLNNTDGYFNTGTKNPNVQQGQQVAFTAKPGKRAGSFDVDVASIQVAGGTTVAPEAYSMTSQSATGARRSDSFVDKDQYWKNREAKDEITQKRIEIQAARNAAIAALGPVGDGNFDGYVDNVNLLTDKFLANNEQRLNA
jgi:hypothetical protein